MSRSQRTAALLCMASATLLIYWSGLHGGFILDDYLFLVDQPALHIHALTAHALAGAMASQGDTVVPRPLSYLSFALNFYLTGLDPFWMKLTNLLIHVGNGLLLFRLLRVVIAESWRESSGGNDCARRADILAALVATAWMLAPINVSAVLYVYQRVESAANLFVFAGLWMYVSGRSRQVRGGRGTALIATGVLGGSALGILFKEDAALLPLYAFLLEWLVFGFRDVRGNWSRNLVAFYVLVLALPGIAGSLFIFHSSALNAAWSIRTFTLYERLLTEMRVVVDYAQWTVLPTFNQLSFYHDDLIISRMPWNPPWTLGAICILLAGIAAIWLLRRRQPLVSLGIAWFLAAQLLTATVIPLELVFEHRNYFASAGLLLALISAVYGAVRLPTKWKPAAAAILVLFYAMTTALRAAEWGDPLRLAYAQVQKNPDSARARLDLGQALLRNSGNRNGSAQSDAAILTLERAAKISGASILPESTLIIAANSANPRRKVASQWWRSLDGKLRTQPLGSENLSGLKALTNCAMDRICAAAPEAMVPMYLTAAERYPDRPEVLILYANYATFVIGDLPLARNLLTQALVLDPRNREYRSDLDQVAAAMGAAPKHTAERR